MIHRLKPLVAPVAQVVRWYATPTGAVAAMILGAVFALAALGNVAWAIGVLAAWLGLIVPYKLSRERRDRVKQATALAARVQRNTDDLKILQSDLAMTPTIDELASWQETVDIRIASMQAKAASLQQISESLRRQRDLS